MYNKIVLVGRLGANPDIRYTPSGKAVASFSVATTETWKEKGTGERKERTEWHRVVLFGRLAEIAKDHLQKGSLVLFEGPIRTRKWQGQDGQDRYTTEIHADNMKMIGGNKSGSSSDSDSPYGGAEPNDDQPYRDNYPFDYE